MSSFPSLTVIHEETGFLRTFLGHKLAEYGSIIDTLHEACVLLLGGTGMPTSHFIQVICSPT